MKVKLKTLEQLKEEFGFKFDGTYYGTIFNNMSWCIIIPMFKYLGNEMEIEKIDYMDKNYTHEDSIINCLWHELWFEPNDFFKEDEFKI